MKEARNVKDRHSTDNRETNACSIFNKTFASRANLKTHVQLHTGKFCCGQCKKGFYISKDHKEHMRAHKGLKYHCDYCTKSFSSKKGYQCDVCSECFNEKPKFDRHVQTHS